MKKLHYILLLTPIIYLASCSKSNVTPQSQSLEDVIVGTEWCLSNDNEDGFLLAEDGKFYLTVKCQSNTPIGNWEIDGDLIKYRYTENSQEITIVWGEVTEYSENQIKLLESVDSTSTIVSIYTLDTPDIYGCTSPDLENYNPLATCDDGSCCTDCFIQYFNAESGMVINVEIGEFCGSEIYTVEAPGYSHTIEETIVGTDTVPAGTYYDFFCGIIFDNHTHP